MMVRANWKYGSSLIAAAFGLLLVASTARVGAQQSLCATVRIEIAQEVALERQAFARR